MVVTSELHPEFVGVLIESGSAINLNVVAITFSGPSSMTPSPKARVTGALKADATSRRYHAAVRASNLYERSHIERFNIVTGEELPQPIKVPTKPSVPEVLIRSGKI